MVVVGTKADKEPTVPQEDIGAFQNSYALPMYDTSSKTDQSVDEAFLRLVSILMGRLKSPGFDITMLAEHVSRPWGNVMGILSV